MADSKFATLIEQIEKLSVLDLSELVKELEEKFGVSAAAPMMMGAMPAAGGADAAPAEEKTAFTVVLTDGGANKINAIKAVREVRSDLGLKEAKDLVDGAPKEVLTNVKKDEADAAVEKLKAAGATVEVK
jgi:large subunit ribosomal protein L7/L12